jgi:hypothetical protein
MGVAGECRPGTMKKWETSNRADVDMGVRTGDLN